MSLRKPAAVESDPFKSAKWDELTSGRAFSQSDAPTLALLCQWHKIAEQAMDELDGFGGETAYSNDMNDLKAFPQISTLKTASAEIRQLNKQLGIIDTVPAQQQAPTSDKGNILQLTIAKRAKKASKAV